MKNFNLYLLIKSFFYFLGIQFNSKKYNVIIIYPSHFNRNTGVNLFFEKIIKILKEKNISHIVFENISFGIGIEKRNNNHTPFDFISIMNNIIRKITKNPTHQLIRKFNSFLFRNLKTKNIITIANTFTIEFQDIYKNVNIFDMQHGILFPKHQAYKDFLTMPLNNKIFLHGEIYKDLLLTNNKNIDSRLIVLGHPYLMKLNIAFNKRNLIIITSNLDDREFISSEAIDNPVNAFELIMEHETDIIIKCCEEIKNTNFKLIYKPHPRASIEVINNIKKLNIDNVTIYNNDIINILEKTFLNLTIASTSTFEFSSAGIPTCLTLDFLNVNRNFNKKIFYEYFNYPLRSDLKIIDQVKTYINDRHKYIKDSDAVYNWYWNHHREFSESEFLFNLKQ